MSFIAIIMQIKEILEANSNVFKKWSDLKKNGLFYQHKELIKNILDIISGNDIEGLIKDILTLIKSEELGYKCEIKINVKKNIKRIY